MGEITSEQALSNLTIAAGEAPLSRAKYLICEKSIEVLAHFLKELKDLQDAKVSAR